MELLRSLLTDLEWLKQARNNVIRLRVQRQLINCKEFVYTSDWLSVHLDCWQTCLAPVMARENVHALEIGSFEGRSAVWLLEHVLTHHTSTITCIDPFLAAGQESRFDHNISLTRRAAQLTKRKGFSGDILTELVQNHFDLIYIDGSHKASSVLLDGFLSWPLLKSGGILIFDDYQLKKGERISQSPKLGIDLFLEHHAGMYQQLHTGSQVILKKKSAR